MKGPGISRFARAAMVCVLAPIGTAWAGPRVEVRGTARFDVQATKDGGQGFPGQGELVLRGTLSDDAGMALAKERVQIELQHVGYPNDPQVADALRSAKPCDAANVADRPPANDAAWVRTDEGGHFCIRMALVMDRYVASLSYAGTKLVDAARVDVKFDLSRRALSIRLDPEPRVIWLDAKELVVDAVVETDEGGIGRPAPGKRISLGSDAAHTLAEATTNGSGRASFRVPMEKVGPPGRGELRASFIGDHDTSFAEQRVDVLRRATVTLRSAAPAEPRVPDDGIPMLVDVAAARGSKLAELVGEGSVEARVGGVVVGAAPVEVGRARLNLVFAAGKGDFADVQLRYVPTSPWFDGHVETSVRVPVKSPSPLRRLPLVVAALAVIGWLALGRRARRVAPVKHAPAPEKNGLSGTAAVELVRTLPRPGKPRWVGVVRDAHDGTSIEGADVAIERGSFSGRTILARTTTDRAGRFELELPQVHGTDVLAVEGPLHASLRQRIPASGELSIAVVMRKRKIVDRLVRWARQRGGAFDAEHEPTPSLVRAAAGDDSATERWADAVERAAFDSVVVDAKQEARIQALMPGNPDPEAAPPDPAPPGAAGS